MALLLVVLGLTTAPCCAPIWHCAPVMALSLRMRHSFVVVATALALTLTSASDAGAKSSKAPLKSCVAALDAAEAVGVKADLYVINARRCRNGINAAEVARKKTGGPYTPVPSDFQLAVVVLEKSCFGSAGCNVTYRIDVTYVGAQPPDPKQTFTVSYELVGGEDPKIGSFSVRGDTASVSTEDFISTPPNPTLIATPTQVLKG